MPILPDRHVSLIIFSHFFGLQFKKTFSMLYLTTTIGSLTEFHFKTITKWFILKRKVFLHLRKKQ